jgi:creatinine amidohydrolase
MQTMLLEEMTWLQIEELLESGTRTVIVPVGAVEQHGKHLPLNTDTLIAKALAREVARLLGNCVVGPVVSIGCSAHHMAFPGTVSLRSETLQEIVKDYCRSLARHGFETIIIIPSHGGDFPPVQAACEILEEELAGVKLIGYTDQDAFIDLFSRLAGEFGLVPQVAGSHAGDVETSLIMAIAPQLVDAGNMEPGYTGPDEEIDARINSEGMKGLAPNGVLGDPRTASPEHGQVYLQRFAAEIVKYVRDKPLPDGKHRI